MFKGLQKITKDCFTGPDGVTYDPARVLWIVGIVAFLAFTAHGVFKDDKAFDMVNFGLAYGGLLAAGAAGVKVKETTEPKATVVTTPTPAAPPPFTPPAPMPPAPAPVAAPAPIVQNITQIDIDSDPSIQNILKKY